MFVSTLLSALPLLTPALPAQEPAHRVHRTPTRTQQTAAATQRDGAQRPQSNSLKQRAQKRWKKVQARYVQDSFTSENTANAACDANERTQRRQARFAQRTRFGSVVTNNVHPTADATDVSALATIDARCCQPGNADCKPQIVQTENDGDVHRLAFVTETRGRRGVAWSNTTTTEQNCDVSALATIPAPANRTSGNWVTPADAPQGWPSARVNPAHERAFGVSGLASVDTRPRAVRTFTGTTRTETTKTNNAIKFRKNRRAPR